MSGRGRFGDPVLLFCSAFLDRVLWVHLAAWPSGDGTDYLRLARSVALQHRFSLDGNIPTAYRPPLYPAVIAALWRDGADPTAVVMLLQAVLGAATVVLTYLLARDRFERSVALLAAVLMMLAPMSSRYVATVLTETLFTFLVVLGVYLWGRGRSVPAGVALGLGALTRPTLLPFLCLLPFAALLPGSRRPRRIFVVMLLVALLPVGLWTARNALVLGRFIPVVSWGWGRDLYLSTLDIRLGSHPMKQVLDDPEARYFLAAPDAGDPPGGEIRAVTRAVERARGHPARWLRARATQYPRLFVDTGEYLLVGRDQVTFAEAWKAGRIPVLATKVGFTLGNLLVFTLAGIGFWRERGRIPDLAHIWLFPAFLMAVHLVVYVEPRFGLPMMPMIFVFAASGAVHAGKVMRTALGGN